MVLTESQTRAAYWMGCTPFRTWFTWQMYKNGGKRTEAQWHALSTGLGGAVSAAKTFQQRVVVELDEPGRIREISDSELAMAHVLVSLAAAKALVANDSAGCSREYFWKILGTLGHFLLI